MGVANTVLNSSIKESRLKDIISSKSDFKKCIDAVLENNWVEAKFTMQLQRELSEEILKAILNFSIKGIQLNQEL